MSGLTRKYYVQCVGTAQWALVGPTFSKLFPDFQSANKYAGEKGIKFERTYRKTNVPAFLLKANQPEFVGWDAAKEVSFTAYLLTDGTGKTIGAGNWPSGEFVDDLGIWPFISDATRIRNAKAEAHTKGLVQKGGVYVKP